MGSDSKDRNSGIGEGGNEPKYGPEHSSAGNPATKEHGGGGADTHPLGKVKPVANPVIEEFGRLLVEKVRDVVIQTCDRRLGPDAQSVVAKRWREAMRHATPESFAKEIIPDIVDDTIGGLLVAIDQGLLQLSFTASTGEIVNLVSVAGHYGELSGSYGPGTSSWVNQYSKERFSDDLCDLDDMFSA